MLLIRGQPIHPMPLQNAMHRGHGDCHLMEPFEVGGDPTGSEVVVLTQVEDLADHLAWRGSRRSLRRPRPIAQAGVTVLGVTPLPLVERLAGNAEPAADARDILLVCRLL